MERSILEQDLAAIRGLMAESQSFLSGTWPHQLVWGVVGTAGLLATWWGLSAGQPELIGWSWGGALLLGWGFSIRSMRSGARRGPVRNVASRAFGSIWLSLGVTLTLLATASLTTGAVTPQSLPALIALMFGAGYYASGFLAGLRWLKAVGVAWWAGGIMLMAWRGPGSLLALAAMAVALQVLPALALRKAERRELGSIDG